VFDSIPEFNQELNDNNIRPIFLSTGFPAGFFGTKSCLIYSKSNSKNGVLQVSGTLIFLKSAGAEPVKNALGTRSLWRPSDGRLDGILVNIDSAYNLDLHKTAKTLAYL